MHPLNILPLLGLIAAGIASFGFDPQNREISRGLHGGAEGFQGRNLYGSNGMPIGRMTGMGGGIGPLLAALTQQHQIAQPQSMQPTGLPSSLAPLLLQMQPQHFNMQGLLNFPNLSQQVRQ